MFSSVSVRDVGFSGKIMAYAPLEMNKNALFGGILVFQCCLLLCDPYEGV